MNRVLILLILLTSCGGGGSSDGGGDVSSNCSTDASLIRETWLDTATNDLYGLESCGVNQDCAYCNLTCGDSFNDFKINYNTSGVSIEYYYYGNIKIGTWQVCDDVLTINWNDGDEMIFARQ